MPFLLERLDSVFTKSGAWADLDPVITDLPSSYVPGRVYGCFFDDMVGVDARHQIGVGQLVFETDYPHQDSTWPNTMDVVAADRRPGHARRIGNARAHQRHRDAPPRSGRPATGGQPMSYDLVIRNGRVVDGSGLGSLPRRRRRQSTAASPPSAASVSTARSTSTPTATRSPRDSSMATRTWTPRCSGIRWAPIPAGTA